MCVRLLLLLLRCPDRTAASFVDRRPGSGGARHGRSWMQPGLDGIGLQALVMQSLALEQPVELGLALRSVGAEVDATDFVQGTRAFRQETANAALRAAGYPAPALRHGAWVLPLALQHRCQAPPGPTDWGEERVREWRQQREDEVKEERQQAADEYTASVHARLGDDRLLLLSPTGVNQSWLAHVLRWVRACVGCSVPPAQAHKLRRTLTRSQGWGTASRAQAGAELAHRRADGAGQH